MSIKDLLIQEPNCLLLVGLHSVPSFHSIPLLRIIPSCIHEKSPLLPPIRGVMFIGFGIGEGVGTIISRSIEDALTNWFLREKIERRNFINRCFDLFLQRLCNTCSCGNVFFAFTVDSSIHWIVPILAGIPGCCLRYSELRG